MTLDAVVRIQLSSASRTNQVESFIRQFNPDCSVFWEDSSVNSPCDELCCTALLGGNTVAAIVASRQQGKLLLQGPYVNPEFGNLGLGTRLLDHICSLPEAKDCTLHVISIPPSLLSSATWYSKQGFIFTQCSHKKLVATRRPVQLNSFLVRENRDNLYSIDFVVDADNTPHFLEFNALSTYWDGSFSIYGDQRVSNEIFARIVEAHQGQPIVIRENYYYRTTLEEYCRLHHYPFRIGQGETTSFPNNLERITQNKLSTYGLVRRDLSLRSNVPATVSCHDTCSDSFRTFLEAYKSDDLLIYKPNSSLEGKGIIFFLTRDNALNTLTSRNLKRGMLQEFILSRPVFSKRTKQTHAASVRSLYFNGFIDAYWRMAAEPMGEKEMPRNHAQVCCAIAQGGHAEAMDDETKSTIAEYSSRFVAAFEGRDGSGLRAVDLL